MSSITNCPVISIYQNFSKNLLKKVYNKIPISCLLSQQILPIDTLHDIIENNELSQGHAKILVGLDNAYFVAKKIIDKELSVRQSENLVKIYKSKKIFKNLPKDANLKELQFNLAEKIGLNVSIKNKKNNTGSISFEYKDLEQLNKLIEVIKSNY